MRIWLTRSQPGAARQARELEQAGCSVLVAPVLGIEPTAAQPPEAPADWVFFLSEQAVRHALTLEFCAGARVFAVGERTRAALAEAGVAARCPPHASSEGLLELPELQSAERRSVLIVAGESGRTELADGLRERGATVALYLCYRRVVLADLDVRPEDVDVIVAASGDGLAAAAKHWRGAGGPPGVPVLVPSRRVGLQAQALGFQTVVECEGADSRAILSALEQL